MPTQPVEHWASEPEAHDYPAALDYLTLMMPAKQAKAAVRALKKAPLSHRKAKDLLRASGLAALPKTNVHVAKDLAKVAGGTKLSPVLIVRDDTSVGSLLLIADGYHRVCASYLIDENADIPCKLCPSKA